MEEFSRNDTEGLANRTWKNFTFIEEQFNSGADVHVVTQLICSMLALVVFPWQRHVSVIAEERTLEELARKGWPQWDITEGRVVNLAQLIRRLRNGIAHSHIWFSSESRHLHEVKIEVSDYRPKDNLLVFRARMNGNDLREFCKRFSQYIQDVVG